MKRKAAFASSAFQFVLLMGAVNFFGDMTYEGGAAINGPFMRTLGAGSAAIWAIVAGVALTALFPPLVFFGGFWLALAGLLFWGIGYATQDTLLKALIASVLPEGRRSLAFGLFYLGYGGGWLVGSIITGLLYERSRMALTSFPSPDCSPRCRYSCSERAGTARQTAQMHRETTFIDIRNEIR